MKRFPAMPLLVVLIAIFSFCGCGNRVSTISSSSPEEGFAPQLNGTMMPYDFSAADTAVPWGKEMKPAFISYVARHGARFLSSEKKVEKIAAKLEKADGEGNLSESGKEFLNLLHHVDSVTAGRWGALNDVGIYEEQRLGKEMFLTAPGLLEKGRVEAVATYVPRVVMTMYEVCHSLAVCSSDIEVSTSEGKQFNPLLRYFKTDSLYAAYIDHGGWLPFYEDFVERKVPARPALSLFKDSSDADTMKMKELTLDMYGVLQSLPASEIDWDPERWFSASEYAASWQAANLKHYYQRSVSRVSDLPARSALPLLQDMISSIDKAISSGGDGNLKASLRFGHAETVIPLFALMRLPGCYAPDCAPDSVASVWKDWNVAPLGANLMIVVLKSDAGGSVNAALRLNGKWLNLDGNKIIPWTDLRMRLTNGL